MSNKWVVNASPLILLAKIGQTNLLAKLTEELVVPAAVVAEIEQGPVADPARLWVRGEGSKWVQPDANLRPEIAAWDLGAGETAVLNWALGRPQFEAIIDDRAARKCAQVQGILCRGTLGVVLAAKKRGIIPAAKPFCEQLLQAGMLIDTSLVRDALNLADE